MTQDIEARKDRIFDIVVKAYIETAEPVGSGTICKHSDLGLSSATIRNVMADLEEEGLLAQPHTSAGRIPTDRGYRYWVDDLMEPEELEAKEKSHIRGELSKEKSVESLAEKVSDLVSELTGNAGVFYLRNLRKVSFLNHLLQEIIEDRRRLEEMFHEVPGFFVEGMVRVFEQPEFQDMARMRRMLQVLNDKEELLRHLFHDVAAGNEEPLHIYIGSENEAGEFEGVSVVTRDCFAGALPIGGVAVVGPTRMHYPKAVSTVNFLADTLSEMMERF